MGTFWVQFNQYKLTNKLMNQLETLYLNHIEGGNELKDYIKSLISNRLKNPNDKELKLKEEELRNLFHLDIDISADVTFQLHSPYATGSINFADVNEALDGVKEVNEKQWDIDDVDRESRIELDCYELSCGEIDVEDDFDISVNDLFLNEKGASTFLLEKQELKCKKETIEWNKKRIDDLNKEISKLEREVWVRSNQII